MTKKNTREIGAEKEAFVVEYLRGNGYVITDRNFRCRQGEIDIIGYDGEYLVFVEVKYRSSNTYDTPLAAVGLTKQKKICRVADYYRYTHGISADTPIRYDVAGILKEEIVLVKNAFPHRYSGR